MPTFTSAYNASKISQYRPTANSISSKRSIPHRASADTILLAALLAPLPINLFPLWVQINRMESGRLLRRETEVSNRRNCHLFLVPPATHRKDCSGGGGGRGGGVARARGKGKWERGMGGGSVRRRFRWKERKIRGQARRGRPVCDWQRPIWLCPSLPFALCRPRYASCCTRICAFMQSQNRRPVHSRPSIRPCVRITSLSLSPSHTLASDNRSRRVAAPLHFFARPSLNAVSIPRDTSSSRGTASLRRGDTSIELNSRRSKDRAIVYEVNNHQFFLLHLVV